MDQGYIKLHRKFFENTLWKEPREYSKAEAWLDLIQSARFESSQVILNGRVIEVQMSEVAASRRYLEKRWGWGSTKVNNFLDYLKKNQMITTKQTSGQTIITLCNYERYNGKQTREQTTDKPATNQRQTSDKPKEKKEKKDNIIPPAISNEIASPPIGEPEKTIDSGKEAEQTRIKLSQQEKEKNCGKREKEFYDQLVPWVSIYGQDMIRKFFDYWRERNKSRTKMRFELQQTWDLAGRLRTWEQKQNDYGKRGKTSCSSSKQDDAELMQHIAAGYARGMQERENR